MIKTAHSGTSTRSMKGRHLLERALALHGSGPYVIQAAIADLHLRQPRDWAQIALLYNQLEHLTSSPVVGMNRAIAVAELEGPEAALAVLHQLEGLDGYRYYHSTRADLLRRAGRSEEARAAYARALRGPSSDSFRVASPSFPTTANDARTANSQATGFATCGCRPSHRRRVGPRNRATQGRDPTLAGYPRARRAGLGARTRRDRRAGKRQRLPRWRFAQRTRTGRLGQGCDTRLWQRQPGCLDT